jgi:hypothetical protein
VIAEAANNLIQLIKTNTQYTNVGYAMGARAGDPMNNKVPLPYAWVIFMGDQVETLAVLKQPCVITPRLRFVVRIGMRWANQTTTGNDIMNDTVLLENTITSIQGQAYGNSQWRYEGQTLTELDDRQIWDQSYSIVLPYK